MDWKRSTSRIVFAIFLIHPSVAQCYDVVFNDDISDDFSFEMRPVYRI
jgi:hypothetical protein